jgi:hypothetical protein
MESNEHRAESAVRDAASSAETRDQCHGFPMGAQKISRVLPDSTLNTEGHSIVDNSSLALIKPDLIPDFDECCSGLRQGGRMLSPEQQAVYG